MIILYLVGGFVLIIITVLVISWIWESYTKSKREETKYKFEQSVKDFDTSDSFGDDRCTVYSDKTKKQIMIVAVSLNNTKTKVIDNFNKTVSLFTKDCKYVYDNENKKLLCVYTDGDTIISNVFEYQEDYSQFSVQNTNPLPPQMFALGRVAVLVDESIGVIRFVYFNSEFKQETYKYTDTLSPRDKSYITFNYHFANLANYYIVVSDDFAKVLVVINQNIVFKSFNYSDIINVSYIENEETISSKSTTRTIGGAIVGGVIGGNVGAIIGGLSGAAKESKIVSSMKLKILLRSTSEPSYIFNLYIGNPLDLRKDIDKSLYETNIESGLKLKDTISVIIDKIDREEKVEQPKVEQGTTLNIADELGKLANLKAQGILTEEEFQKQKEKLLNN